MPATTTLDAASPAAHTTTGLILGDHDTNTPSTRTRLFENYDHDRGENTVWLCTGDGGDGRHFWHFTWQTGAHGFGQRLVHAGWDSAGRGALVAQTVLHKDLPPHSRVVLTLGSLDFNQRLLLETVMQDTPVPALSEGTCAGLRKEWCKQVVEQGVAMKIFSGFELRVALELIDQEDKA